MEATTIDPKSTPSGEGCEECTHEKGWWLHLRRCALCGHVGCCDSSPKQHAMHHAKAMGHPVITSFEPGEDWFYDYQRQEYIDGPALAPPHAHPASQSVPGPDGRVPPDWQRRLHP